MPSPLRFLHRLLLYLWALPASMLGVLCIALSLPFSGRVRVVQGALEAHGGFITLLLTRGMPWMAGGAAAMTLGHVILGADPECLARTRRHEHVHVRQYERWGPLMIPLYLFYSLVLWRQGRDAYLDNPFEVEAYDHS